jgi:NitT/TauT family transport system substrate-binding protein
MPKRSSTYQYVLAFIVVVSLVLAACGPSETEVEATEVPPTDVPEELEDVIHIFGAPSRPVAFSNFWIGTYLGFFQEEGLRLLQQGATEGPPQAMQLTATGKADLNTPAPEAMIFPAAEGTDTGLIYVCNATTNTIFELVTLEGSGLTEFTDLAGKKIGVPALGSHPSLLYAAGVLRSVGIDPDTEVEFISVGIDMSAGLALQNGDVDALSIWDDPYVSMELNGVPLYHMGQTEKTSKLVGSAIAVRRTALENPEERERILGYLRAITKGAIFLAENPEATVTVHWALYPESKPTGVSEEEAFAGAMKRVEQKFDNWEKPVTGRWCEFPDGWVEAYLDHLGMPGAIEDTSMVYTNELVEEINDFDEDAVREWAKNYTFDQSDFDQWAEEVGWPY